MNRALRAATVGVLLLSPVVLSACSAGQVAQTGTQVRDKTGGRAQVGNLALREVALAFPDSGSYSSGDDAELQMAIANDGAQDDTLTGISGQGFSRAVFTGRSSAAATPAATAATAATTPASTSPSATPTGAPAASSGAPAGGTPTSTAPASTSAAPSTPAGPPVPTELAIPAGQTVFVGTGTTHITLTGLQSALTTGQYVTLTLSFQKAGDVTVKATVANPTTPLGRSDAYNFDQTGG